MTLIYSFGKIRTPNAVHLWRSAIVATLGDIDTRLRHAIFDAADVHALRRAAKQLRAYALLAPPSLAVIAHETRQHADLLRRSLGDARDAEVRRHTLDVLLQTAESEAASLASALDAPGITPPAPPTSLKDTLSTLTRTWSGHDVSDGGHADMLDALSATYGRARKRAKKAKVGTIEDLHRWRRSVVDLDLQLQPFSELSRPVARTAKRAAKLRDLLGRVNDIDALIVFLERSPNGHPEALDALRSVSTATQKRLRRKIGKAAKRLFKRSPKVWSAELAAHPPFAPSKDDATNGA